MIEIIPAILEKEFEEIMRKLARLKGLAETVQIDVCDGRFSPSKTWPYAKGPQTDADFTQTYAEKENTFPLRPPSTEGGRQKGGGDKDFADLIAEKKGLPFWDSFDVEFDLMVQEPEGVIADYVKAGASRIVLHVESTAQLPEIIHEWQHSVTLSLAASIETPLSVFADFAHHVKDFQLMGIAKIGLQGQAFDERVVERVRTLRQRYPKHILSVDGGVSLQNAPALVAAGANCLVVGSAIWRDGDVRGMIERFSKSVA